MTIGPQGPTPPWHPEGEFDDEIIHKAREIITKHLLAAHMEAMRHPTDGRDLGEIVEMEVHKMIQQWKGVMV